MEDIPDEKSEDEADGESEEGPDEQMGDLDTSDPSAVDEKLWGDEAGPQDPNQKDEKTNQDRSSEQSGPSDVVAREGSQAPEPQEKPIERKDEEPVLSTPEDEAMPDNEKEDDQDYPDASGAPMDEHIPDANTLDLPDDIDLGDGEELPDNMDVEDEVEDDAIKGDEEGHEEPPNNHDDVHDDSQSFPDDQPDAEVPAEAPAEAQVADGDDPTPENDEPSEEHAVAKPDISSGDGFADEHHDVGDAESAPTGSAGVSAAKAGQDAIAQEQALDQDRYGIRCVDEPKSHRSTVFLNPINNKQTLILSPLRCRQPAPPQVLHRRVRRLRSPRTSCQATHCAVWEMH